MLSKTPHTIVTVPTKAPTRTEDGYTESRTCSVCKQVFSVQETVAQTGHTYGNWIKNDAPNPTAWTHKRTCITCGYENTALAVISDTGNPNTPQTQPSAPAPTGNSTPTTESSPTEPVDSPKDTGDSKNALIFVAIGIGLLGLATSGIIILKPKFTRKKAE